MSIANVVLLGFSTGSGGQKVATLGFAAGAAAPETPKPVHGLTWQAPTTSLTWANPTTNLTHDGMD